MRHDVSRDMIALSAAEKRAPPAYLPAPCLPAQTNLGRPWSPVAWVQPAATSPSLYVVDLGYSLPLFQAKGLLPRTCPSCSDRLTGTLPL